nr:hypothetical protein [Tanacetum cinerariifolium]
MSVKEVEKEDEAETEPNRKAGKEEATEAPSSQPVEYYPKHMINENLIEGLVDNHRKDKTLLREGDEVRQIKSKNFKSKHPALVKVEGEMDDEGEVTKAHLLEDKQIPSVGAFEEVFSIWMVFRANTRDLVSFIEETDEIPDLHKIHQEVLFSERGDGVESIKQRRHGLSGHSVWILATMLQFSRLKVDIEPSTWRRRQKHQATPSRRYAKPILGF